MRSAFRTQCGVVWLCFAGILALAPLATQVGARTRLAAEAVEQSVAVVNGFADAKFKIKFTNDDETEFSNVFVTFSDGLQVSLGDVAAGASVVSPEQTRSIDLSDNPSTNVALPVTLTFSADGEPVEVSWVISLQVQ